MARHDHQRTTTQRGLGYPHQKLRARLLAEALRQSDHGNPLPCPRCHRPMLRGQDLDLDHELPRALGGQPGTGRMAHRYCNRAHGARLGAALRAAQQARPRRAASRRW